MNREEMTLTLEHAKRDERHLNHAETRYWCRMYRDIAEKAIEALAEQQECHCNQGQVCHVCDPILPAQYSDIVSDGGMDPRNKFDKPAQQEPVAWIVEFDDGYVETTTRPVSDWKRGMWESAGKRFTVKPLYTSPQPAQQQKPVACKTLCELCVKRGYNFCANAAQITPISSPQPSQSRSDVKPWVGLTGDEISECWGTGNVVAAVEAKLREKNGL